MELFVEMVEGQITRTSFLTSFLCELRPAMTSFGPSRERNTEPLDWVFGLMRVCVCVFAADDAVYADVCAGCSWSAVLHDCLCRRPAGWPSV